MENFNIARTYKDRLFRRIFSDKASLLELYNALNGTEYTEEAELTVNDLEDAVYMRMKNDRSFVLESLTMNFYEHQSTWCPNMPLRGFFYAADAYRAYVEAKEYDLYSMNMIKLPTPKYVIFYNGDKEVPDSTEVRLSDMFEYRDEEDVGKFEWTATVLNINTGHNKELMDKCRKLNDYSILIGKVKEYKKGAALKEAIEKAVSECITEGVLREFLVKNRGEVVNTLLTEYNEEKTMANLYKEAKELGIEEGMKLGKNEAVEETARKLKKEGLSYDLIARCTGLTDEEIKKL